MSLQHIIFTLSEVLLCLYMTWFVSVAGCIISCGGYQRLHTSFPILKQEYLVGMCPNELHNPTLSRGVMIDFVGVMIGLVLLFVGLLSSYRFVKACIYGYKISIMLSILKLD